MDQRMARESETMPARSVAEAYLALLADRGVDYLFGNAGTDFAPIIEAYSHAAQTGVAVPQPILAAHENLAVSMAHGYGMVSRRIPAVMAHVSVGTANMICAALNASRENVAMLLSAGRSPLTETGLLGSRDGYIHWAQEMYDQAGMLREIVKWEYELRNAEQLPTVVDRALSIAASEPRGPVYLSLPREVIAAPASGPERLPPSRLNPASPAAPDASAITAAADLLARAKRPLIVTSNAGRDPAAFAALAQFTERFAIPVVQHRPRYLSLPSSHPMNLGFSTARLLPDADVILVIECDVPWIPSQSAPGPDCKVIQCGLDPLFARYPIRGFASDVAITGGTVATLTALTAALDGQSDARSDRVARALDQRRARLADGGLGRRAQGSRRQSPARSGLGESLHRPGEGSARHRDQRIHAVPGALRIRVSRSLFRIELRIGAGLGTGRCARRQAGAPGQPGHGGRRRRRLHVQQSCRRASRVSAAQSADPHRGHEQCDVGRGPAQHARDVSGRTGAAQQ